MFIYDLKTNHRLEHCNIETSTPVFSWKIGGEEQNIYQKSYRILVYTETGMLMWNSGKIVSSKITDIVYDGEKLLSDTRYLWKTQVETESDNKEEWIESEETFFETALFHQEEWKGVFIGETEDFTYHLFRKTFEIDKPLKKAKLYICGLGHFECWMNGQKITDYVLEPGWSAYEKTSLYTSYDVTNLIQGGENAVLVKLGDGMFNVPGGRYVYYERSYGKCKFQFQLVLTDEEENKQYIVSDKTWKMTESPVKFCCIYGGEDYDGRLWKEEYLYPDYRETDDWKPVVCVEPPIGVLRAVQTESLKIMERYQPVKICKLSEDRWLYDFGKNFSGWVRIRMKTNGNMAGRKIVFSPKELANENGGFSTGAWDSYAWTYILNEKTEQEFVPDFTYTGFRYVEMSGAVPAEYCDETETKDIILTNAEGEFLYPDLEQGGDFLCSNELFNNIHQIVLQAIKSNTKSYFTDCPHREKLGWLEQSHLIGPSIMYNLNVQNLYGKMEQDMADSQRENGLIPDIAPEYVKGFEKWHWGFLDSPEWGCASVLAPWYAYKRYGNTDILKQHYDVMKQYMAYLDSKSHHEVLHHGLGDWLDIGPCTPHSQNTPVPIVATAVWYYAMKKMEKIAELLGKTEDLTFYQEKTKLIFKEYNLQFLDDQTGRYGTGSQCAQSLSLIAGLVPENMQEKVRKQLYNEVTKRNYAITAGDVGHPFLIAALMKYGMNDLLDKMTNITETPGYGYQVVHGATTLTEEWDGPDPKRPHGSQNHLMLGSIEEWFYGGLGGIELIRNEHSIDEISICPQPVESVQWCETKVIHPYGEIYVKWEKLQDAVHVTVDIPGNLTAYLKASDGRIIKKAGSGRYKYQFSL